MSLRHLSLLISLFLIQDLCRAQKTISGTIVDSESNEPLEAVHIVEKDNSSNGTITNAQGYFKIEVTSNKISVSHIGYTSFEIETTNFINGDIIKIYQNHDDLNQVVVTGNKTGNKMKELTISIERLEPDLIQDKNPIQFDEIVDQVPGINVTDGQVSIRGGSGWSYGAGSRVIVMVDGIPLLSGDAGQALWTFISTENIEQVEVVKGASSVLYGSSALNGIINIRSAWAKEQPITKVSTFGGVYSAPPRNSWKWSDKALSTYGVRMADRRKIGKSDFVSHLEALNDQGYRKGDFDERLQGGVNWRYRLTDSSFAGLRTKIFKNHSGSFLLWKNYDSAYLPLDGSNTENNNFRLSLNPFYTKLGKNGFQHRLKGRYLLVENKVDNGDPDNDQSNHSDWLFGEYLVSKRWNKGPRILRDLKATAGVTGSFTKTSSPLFKGDQKATNTAIFTQLSEKISIVNLEFGVRLERYTLNDLSEVQPIFRTGLSLPLTSSTFFRASFGQGFRFPTIAESYISTTVGPVTVYPNEYLNSETGTNREIGITQGLKFGEKWNGILNWAWYDMEYQDMMEFTFGQWSSNPTPQNNFGIGFKSINTGMTRISGHEISTRLKRNGKNSQLKIFAGYTYSNPVSLNPSKSWGTDSLNNNVSFITTSSDTANYYLKYRSRHLIKADVSYAIGPIEIGISARYNSRIENIDAAFENELMSILIPGVRQSRLDNNQGDFITDFRAFCTFNEDYRIGLVVNNLFNEDRYVRPADMGPPRLVMVQFQYQR